MLGHGFVELLTLGAAIVGCFLPTFSTFSAQVHAAGLMGIDFGTDWYKVALVKPGIPLELILNKESQRKTDALVTIRDGVRYFGSEGASLVNYIIII